ncbi:MAG: FHA domain-containing protein [Clostridiales bacterium]|nr:FHA domain-containing protein [Clostridiales bacterium]
MKTRKGPYGYFAIYELNDNEEINTYAMEILENEAVKGFLTVFKDEWRNRSELNYDYSGLVNICDNKVINSDKKIRRKAIGNLFELILKMQDILLPLNDLILDPQYIFTDENNIDLRLCYLPLIEDHNNEISSLDAGRFEEMIRHPFFSDAITEDEISTLIYSIRSNDENMFKEALDSIKNDPMPKEKGSVREKFSMLIIITLSVITTVLAALFLNKIYAIILAVIFIGLIVKTFVEGHREDKGNLLPNELYKERTKILFDKDPDVIDEDNLFSFASLESNEDKSAYGLYAKETKIGSDRFLSDIYIDDKKISSLQAKLIREDNSFYIIDCSKNNNTYIENRTLIPNQRYEIKNGQLIGFGDKEYTFKIT